MEWILQARFYVRPLFEKDGEMHKVYIAFFTCASSHAIHLDLVPSLEVSPFFKCLKRFFSCRGVGKLFISDNAKTFQSQDLKKFLLKNHVKWEFNLPRSPWWGGFFERLVRCTKRCLKKILGSAGLTYEELLMLLVETECVLNSRPLTYVYSQEDDVEEPLSPLHFLLGRRLLSRVADQEDLGQEVGNEDRENLSERARYMKLLLNHFWHRWRMEYLTELRQHHAVQWKILNKGTIIKEGDLVILKEDKVPRNSWKLGRVKDLHIGKDGQAHGATVTLPRRRATSCKDLSSCCIRLRYHQILTSSCRI